MRTWFTYVGCLGALLAAALRWPELTGVLVTSALLFNAALIGLLVCYRR